jgi:hypothetical protein
MARKLKKAELIVLATQIQNAQDRGENYDELMAQFQANVPLPDAHELFISDHSPKYIVEFARAWREPLPVLSKEEFLELVKELYSGRGSEARQDRLLEVFVANCKHPAKTDLLTRTARFFDGNRNPTPEEITEKAWTEG